MKLQFKISIFILSLAGVIFMFGAPEDKLITTSLTHWWLLLILSKVIGIVCFYLAVSILQKHGQTEYDDWNPEDKDKE